MFYVYNKNNHHLINKKYKKTEERDFLMYK